MDVQNIDFRKLFAEIRTVAVVGYSDNPQRAGHYVPAYLARHGYEIIAINPRFGDSVDGFRCYARLEDIPAGTQIDVLDIFRAPEHVEALADAAVAMNPRPAWFWMQLGAENEAAADTCRQNGITPVLHECMLAVHRQLFGG